MQRNTGSKLGRILAYFHINFLSYCILKENAVHTDICYLFVSVQVRANKAKAVLSCGPKLAAIKCRCLLVL